MARSHSQPSVQSTRRGHTTIAASGLGKEAGEEVAAGAVAGPETLPSAGVSAKACVKVKVKGDGHLRVQLAN